MKSLTMKRLMVIGIVLVCVVAGTVIIKNKITIDKRQAARIKKYANENWALKNRIKDLEDENSSLKKRIESAQLNIEKARLSIFNIETVTQDFQNGKTGNTEIIKNLNHFTEEALKNTSSLEHALGYYQNPIKNNSFHQKHDIETKR